MPTVGLAPARTRQGFTLLEVLMVVLLVGILSSVVMLSVNSGGPDRYLREESDRLAALIEQAADEAVMQNQEFGLRLTGKGYVFLCLDEAKQQWDYCADSIFRERELEGGLELRIAKPSSLKGLPVLDEDDLARKRREQEEEGEQRLTPDIFLLSSGEASPASLELRVPESPEVRSEINIDAIGRVTRTEDEKAEDEEVGSAS